MSDEIASYLHRKVKKSFPGHRGRFGGTVIEVDEQAEDNLPFFIRYNDGDEEWIGLDELKNIIVGEADEKASQPTRTDGDVDTEGNGEATPASAPKRRGRPPNTGDKSKTPQVQSVRGKRGCGGGRGSGMKRPRLSRRSMGTEDGKDKDEPEVSAHDEEEDGGIRGVLQSDPADSAPRHCRGLLHRGLLYTSLITAPHASSSSEGAQAESYEQEAGQVLSALSRVLEEAGVSPDRIITARVYLASVSAGLPGFKAAWSAWLKEADMPEDKMAFALSVLQAEPLGARRVGVEVVGVEKT